MRASLLSMVWDNSLAWMVLLLRWASQSSFFCRSESCSARRLVTIFSIWARMLANASFRMLVPARCTMLARAVRANDLVWIFSSATAASWALFFTHRLDWLREDNWTNPRDRFKTSRASSLCRMEMASFTDAISSLRSADRAANSVALFLQDSSVWDLKRSSSVFPVLRADTSSWACCFALARAAASSAPVFFADTAAVSSAFFAVRTPL
mmetsp:Transcript_56552/g.123993  ORF Transcript_56552/g.123993 Transcript_56552/m.123993 type:complete len:210 (-) Transcript_56552:787-1416(-)